MATAAQTIANQANARHSTGPRTAEGKAASSRNATSHGLSSPFAVLAHESQQEFNDLIDCLTGEHQPANPHQGFLVDQLAIGLWQLARAQRLVTTAFEHLAGTPAHADDPDARIVARMFDSNPNALTTLQRYAAQAEQSYYRAYRELKTAKQIQTDADAVAAVDSRAIRRMIDAPMPDHPLYGSQYGHPKPAAQNKPKLSTAASAKPSLRSQMPENLALCL